MHNVRIVPLYTTENVLEALKEGEIDIAQFAIYNLLGGIVEESLFALAGFGHRFEMLEKFKHPITYHLMTQK